MASALEVKAINGSVVMAKTAGTELTAARPCGRLLPWWPKAQQKRPLGAI